MLVEEGCTSAVAATAPGAPLFVDDVGATTESTGRMIGIGCRLDCSLCSVGTAQHIEDNAHVSHSTIGNALLLLLLLLLVLEADLPPLHLATQWRARAELAAAAASC